MINFQNILYRFVLGIVLFFSGVSVYAGLLDQKPSGAINDFAGILSPGVKDSLELLSSALFVKTGVALVLVSTSSLDGDNIDNVTNSLFSKWGIGAKGKDEGILILVAPKERAIRIETGYGAEGYLPDVQVNRIIRDIATPYLSKGMWDQGLKSAFLACASLAAKAHSAEIDGLPASSEPVHSFRGVKQFKPNAASVIFFIAIFLVLIGTRTGRSILYMLILSSLFSGRNGGYGSSGFGRGGFGGSGGFGGFGGGMSGGGGASGRF